MAGNPQNYLAVIKVVGIGGGGVQRRQPHDRRRPEGRRVHRRQHRRAGAAHERRRREARHRPRAHPGPRRRVATPRSAGRPPRTHRDEIEEVLKGADMVFITAGKGGGTGTGAAPGRRRDRQEPRRAHHRRRHPARSPSRAGAARCRPSRASRRLKEKVDTLIVIPNDRLLTVVQRQDLDAQRLQDGRRGPPPGRAGHHRPHHHARPHQHRLRRREDDHERRRLGAHGHRLRLGRGPGPQRRPPAISSPLLEASIEGARGILLTIAGGSDLGLFEVNEAAEVIHGVAHPDANIIFGAVIDDEMGDEVRVTVIAAGFDRWDDDQAPGGDAERRPPASCGARRRRRGPPTSFADGRRRRPRRATTTSTSRRSSSSRSPSRVVPRRETIRPPAGRAGPTWRSPTRPTATWPSAGAGAALDARRRRIAARPWTWLRQVHGDPGGGRGRAAASAAGAEADAAVTTDRGRRPGRAHRRLRRGAPGRDRARPRHRGAGHGHRGGPRRLEGPAGRGARSRRRRHAPAWARSTLDWDLGPCIRPRRYEFGATDLDVLADRFGDAVRSTTLDGAPALDLPAAVRAAAAEAGLDPTSVPHAVPCTAFDEGFYSLARPAGHRPPGRGGLDGPRRHRPDEGRVTRG